MANNIPKNPPRSSLTPEQFAWSFAHGQEYYFYARPSHKGFRIDAVVKKGIVTARKPHVGYGGTLRDAFDNLRTKLRAYENLP